MDMASPVPVKAKKKKRKVFDHDECSRLNGHNVLTLLSGGRYFRNCTVLIKTIVFFLIDFPQPPRPKPRKSTQPAKPSDHYHLNLGNIPFVVGQVGIVKLS